MENTNDLDSGILPLVNCLDKFKACKYTIEICDQNNIRYLKKTKQGKTNQFENLPVRYWPIFAKSDIFLSSSLDGILATAFYNEGQLEILLKLLEINLFSKETVKDNITENSRVTR